MGLKFKFRAVTFRNLVIIVIVYHVTECINDIFTVRVNVITVDSVHPLYGPVSGGTRVTITGQFLSVSTVIVVYFGQNPRRPMMNRLWILSRLTLNSI